MYIHTHMLYTYININIYVPFSPRVYIQDIYCGSFVGATTKHKARKLQTTWIYTESED